MSTLFIFAATKRIIISIAILQGYQYMKETVARVSRRSISRVRGKVRLLVRECAWDLSISRDLVFDKFHFTIFFRKKRKKKRKTSDLHFLVSSSRIEIREMPREWAHNVLNHSIDRGSNVLPKFVTGNAACSDCLYIAGIFCVLLLLITAPRSLLNDRSSGFGGANMRAVHTTPGIPCTKYYQCDVNYAAG